MLDQNTPGSRTLSETIGCEVIAFNGAGTHGLRTLTCHKAVHLWLASLTASPEALPLPERCSPTRRPRTAFTFERHQNIFTGARFCAHSSRDTPARRRGQSSLSIRAPESHGSLAAATIHFNVAHSGGLALHGFARGLKNLASILRTSARR